MKKILGLALAGALSVAALPAVAADYPVKAPPPPIWTWTGFYIGVQAGAGWSHTRWQDTAGTTTGDIQGSGGLIGGTLGWNWQAPGSPWVFGIEGDWAWTNITGTTATLCGTTCTTRIDSLGTIRARLGHANGPLLFYITGGGAWASVNDVWPTPPGLGPWDNTNSVWGWSVGAGLEGALGGGWTLKGEYIYADFGAVETIPTPVPTTVQYLRVHVVRAGVNYKF